MFGKMLPQLGFLRPIESVECRLTCSLRPMHKYCIVQVQRCVIALLYSDPAHIAHEPRMIYGSLGFCVDPAYVLCDVELFVCIVVLLLGGVLG